MREILFRGKRIDNDEWIVGHLLRYHGGRARIVETGENIFCYEMDTSIIQTVAHHVDPSTVGQYTGLCDKNGKKIFEGDIVQHYGTYALEVFIENGHAKIRWFDAVTNTKCEELFFGYDEEAYGECEVIGTIHDNPELLEG